MISKSRAKFHVFIFCISFFVGVSVSPSFTLADEVVVITNKNVKVKTLNRNTLRAIFGMRLRNWENGIRISSFVLPDRHPVHRIFAKEVLGVFPHQLRWSWDRLVYSGTGESPISVDSEEALIERILDSPGSIGYLSSTKLSDISDSLQIIEIK